jgi:hypothetical protein
MIRLIKVKPEMIIDERIMPDRAGWGVDGAEAAAAD